MVRAAAGEKVTILILEDLRKLIHLNHFVNSRLICKLLQRALPNRKYVSADNVCKARVRAKMLI